MACATSVLTFSKSTIVDDFWKLPLLAIVKWNQSHLEETWIAPLTYPFLKKSCRESKISVESSIPIHRVIYIKLHIRHILSTLEGEYKCLHCYCKVVLIFVRLMLFHSCSLNTLNIDIFKIKQGDVQDGLVHEYFFRRNNT